MKKLNNLFDKTFLKYLWLSLAPQKGRVILTIICSLFNGVASIAGISAFLPIIVIIRGGDYAKLREFPFLGQFISLLPLNTDQAVTILALGILAIIVVRSIFSAWINLLQIEILIFVEQIWQEKVMNHWLDMDPLRHSRENRAEVMNLCGSELRNAGRAGGSFILLISSIVQVSLIVSFMLITSWQVVTGILVEVAPQVEKKNMTITKQYNDLLTNITSDPKLLRIVIHNLITNALKYTPDGGSISIRFQADANRNQIIVADTGYGIPLSQQHKIFTKLFRADNVKEISSSQSTGLGLYMVKSVVTSMGGDITFVSEENKGTSFIVTL